MIVSVSYKSLNVFLAIIFTLLFSACLNAGVVPLMSDTESWDGGDFAYPEGSAKITAVKLVLEEGKDAPFHCHPIPTMGYITKGEVLLETADGKTQRFAKGDPVIEVMKTVHRGKAIKGKGEAEIIVFYAGAEAIPVTVLPDNKEQFEKYCQ